MSLSVVPSAFQTPLSRPKRDHRTPEGSVAYTELVRLYDLAVARRFAYAQRGRYVCDEDDDVVVDVGGAGEPFVYPQFSSRTEVADRSSLSNSAEVIRSTMSDVVRRLDEELEATDGEDEYEVDSDLEYEENPMKTMIYKLEQMTRAEFDNPMERDCPVCLEELKRADCVTTSCKHSFCATCYEKYPKKRSCPLCRQSVEMLTRYCVEYTL